MQIITDRYEKLARETFAEMNVKPSLEAEEFLGRSATDMFATIKLLISSGCDLQAIEELVLKI